MKTWFGLLLKLYPKGFRDRFGEELLEIVLAKSKDRGGSYWLKASLDLAINAARERWEAADKTIVLLAPLAVLTSLWIGLADLRATEVQGVVLVLLAASAAFGAARPRRAWAWALIVGSGIFATHEVRALMGFPPTYKVEPNDLALLLPLVPAFIGSYVGAGLRTFRDISLEP